MRSSPVFGSERCLKHKSCFCYLGEITVAGNIDREIIASFQFAVCATDNATDLLRQVPQNEQRIGCGMVKLNVNDLNDNVPEFSPDVFELTISEKSPVGMTVVQLKTFISDADATFANGITFFEIETSTTPVSDASKFVIGQESGAITVGSNTLDYEEGQEKYILSVKAYNVLTPTTRSNTLTLTILLADVNDNSPKFILNLYEANVDENEVVGTLIVTVSATDLDGLSSNNQLFYFNLDNSLSSMIHVNSSTGTFIHLVLI